MTLGRIGTLMASDFIYWVLRHTANGGVVSVNTALVPATVDPLAFDVAELVQWAAGQAGVTLPRHADDQIAFMASQGTEVTVSAALAQRGAVLWRAGAMGVSMGNGQTVEAVNAVATIVRNGAAARFTRAAKVPGLRY